MILLYIGIVLLFLVMSMYGLIIAYKVHNETKLLHKVYADIPLTEKEQKQFHQILKKIFK